MTKIVLKRTGGIAGQTVTFDLVLEDLPAQESQGLLQLIQEADFFNLPVSAPRPSNPDEFEYTVTIAAGQTQHTIHTSETAASEPVRTLLQALAALEKAR
jgi:hypothetical protein